MKSIACLMLVMILLSTHTLSAQTKEDYLTKNKNQKRTAGIMLGVGGGLFIISSTIFLVSAADAVADLFTLQPQEPKKLLFANILGYTGIACIAGSIPIFISARSNKRKAMNVSFTQQQVPDLVKNFVANGYVPSVTIQLKL